MSIVDAREGRVLVSPSRAFDGEWVSTFSPGTPFAIAVAIEHLTALLPDDGWFAGHRLARRFFCPTLKRNREESTMFQERPQHSARVR